MTPEQQTKEEMERWAPIDEYIKNMLHEWDARTAYTGEEAKTIVAGNIRTFAGWMFKHANGTVEPKRWVCPFCGTGHSIEEAVGTRGDDLAHCSHCHKAFKYDVRCTCKPGEKCNVHTIDDLRVELKSKERLVEELKERAIPADRMRNEFSLHQTYTREVSLFHRQFLLPLVALVKQMTEGAEKVADVDSKAKLAQVTKFLKTVEDRTKHFEGQALVAQAHQRADEELKRLTVKTGLNGETGEVKVLTTGELAAGTHAPTCAKASNHSLRCDCHLASNYPPP